MSFIDKIKRFFESPQPGAGAEADNGNAGNVIHIRVDEPDELPLKVGALVKANGAKNQALREQIEQKIAVFESDAGKSIEILRNVNLSKRNEYEKIKTTVLDNLHQYIDYMRKLLGELIKLNNGAEQELADYFGKIFSSLNEFTKASYVPYEKATYLIGKEMAAARSLVRQFGQDISALAEQNKALYE